MNENDFEGSLVLEKLGAIGLVEDFFEAIDSDDFKSAISLLQDADVDEETIRAVLKKIGDGE